ncbi:hypothetical protein [Nocardia cyriacigeorgica]|uniref:hypothetical protein n=1 Tax=Nocardia cyriacigeorgica TaxID=135487 RepID=UPI00189341B0|nr:hypothetical protein [Nocardia cyriacigeorgica]MBF6289196.1 hypothetical protein [Nocardia cyriacigeorgica]
MSRARDLEQQMYENDQLARRLQEDIEERRRSTGGASALIVEIERAEAEHEEQLRAEAEERARLEEEAREQREAIARSMAARRANDAVAPIDEDDEEAQYYQRKSWLV